MQTLRFPLVQQALLTTNKPLRNSLTYLAGLSGGYIACGVVGFFLLEKLNSFLARYFPSTQNMSNTDYYKIEMWMGFTMICMGLWYYRKKKNAPPGRSQNWLVQKLNSMNALFAFGLGAFLSVSSFPVSIPYILTLGKIAQAEVGPVLAILYIFVYNIGYALPLLIVLAIYLFVRGDYDDMNPILHEKAKKLNVQLTTWALSGVGAFMAVDASWYYVFGKGLIKGRYW